MILFIVSCVPEFTYCVFCSVRFNVRECEVRKIAKTRFPFSSVLLLLFFSSRSQQSQRYDVWLVFFNVCTARKSTRNKIRIRWKQRVRSRRYAMVQCKHFRNNIQIFIGTNITESGSE